jgi:hypothetical protein
MHGRKTKRDISEEAPAPAKLCRRDEVDDPRELRELREAHELQEKAERAWEELDQRHKIMRGIIIDSTANALRKLTENNNVYYKEYSDDYYGKTVKFGIKTENGEILLAQLDELGGLKLDIDEGKTLKLRSALKLRKEFFASLPQNKQQEKLDVLDDDMLDDVFDHVIKSIREEYSHNVELKKKDIKKYRMELNDCKIDIDRDRKEIDIEISSSIPFLNFLLFIYLKR